jgi:DNA-binding NarL/FixJ family response regulator
VDDAIAQRPLRVVIVDDTPDMRLLLRTALAGRPDLLLVGEAGDGAVAIELAAGLRPDLLILDLEMPVLDGLSALPQLQAVAPDTRIVILSAFPASVHAHTALSSGAVAYVEKSTSITELLDELLRGADLLDAVAESLSASALTSFSRDLGTPSEARRFIETTLASWETVDPIETIQLLVTELVTNVIVHTPGTPDVRVSLHPDFVHVEVSDPDAVVVSPRQASINESSGRGLHLVEKLAAAWGIVQVDAGKVVWFDVARR